MKRVKLDTIQATVETPKKLLREKEFNQYPRNELYKYLNYLSENDFNIERVHFKIEFSNFNPLCLFEGTYDKINLFTRTSKTHSLELSSNKIEFIVFLDKDKTPEKIDKIIQEELCHLTENDYNIHTVHNILPNENIHTYDNILQMNEYIKNYYDIEEFLENSKNKADIIKIKTRNKDHKLKRTPHHKNSIKIKNNIDPIKIFYQCKDTHSSIGHNKDINELNLINPAIKNISNNDIKEEDYIRYAYGNYTQSTKSCKS